MNNYLKKVISVTLAFILLFTCLLPQASFASPLSVQEKETKPQYLRNKEVKRLFEIEDLRDQNTKHFLNSDGTTTAEVTLSPQHYKDSNGKWKDISNDLVSSEDQRYVENKENSFKVHFSKNTNNPNLVSIKNKSGYSLSWGIQDTNIVTSQKTGNSITYPEIFSGVDIEYVQLSQGVKENIILKAPDTSNLFVFNISTEGLIPKVHKDNSIGFYPELGEEASCYCHRIMSVNCWRYMS